MLINHETLGELEADPKLADSVIGRFSVNGADIRLSIQFDGKDKDTVLEFASSIVSQIDKFVSRAAAFAAVELLETYNENWRHYSRSDGKGGYVDVTDPELNEESFSDNLRLSSITICGDANCDLGFLDGGMFAGHAVFVSSFDGRKFENLHASLFG